MPAYAEDLLGDSPLVLRPKADLPVIGFCGWANYSSLFNCLGSYVNALYTRTRAAFSIFHASYFRALRRGLPLRRKAIKVLKKSTIVRTSFVIRDSYSGHAETIRMDPKQAREEYIRNLRDADLALSIKGGGNYSLRFFEALSLGRVPLLLDTECVLPLEKVIDYSAFMVKVPQLKLGKIDRVAADFWRSLTPDRYREMQEKARQAFETHLSVKGFFTFMVEHIL
jgi:hypothetical protein